MQFLNHLETPPFQEIPEIGRYQTAQKIFLIILKVKLLIPELLFTFREKNASFNSFINKGLESIMTFTLLIYISNVLVDFSI